LIKRDYNAVSLQSALASLDGGAPLPRNAVAITIDDGYRDFLEAQRVFRHYEIPSTMYLVTDFLDGRLWLWFDQLKYALEETKQHQLTINVAGREALSVSLANNPERQVAREKISELFKQLENSERVAACERIFQQLEVEIPRSPPSKFAPLTWDEVRTMASDGVEFGAHTKTHPILSQVQDTAQLQEEIQGSKQRLENELRLPTLHFCYPNGRRTDINEATLRAVEESGFRSAVTTERGMNSNGAPPFLLRRLGVEPTIPLQYFQELLAGVRTE
jgi:peptidoglycan/xylan/chitin deacetylase (PgdA/CDA1 family)